MPLFIPPFPTVEGGKRVLLIPPFFLGAFRPVTSIALILPGLPAAAAEPPPPSFLLMCQSPANAARFSTRTGRAPPWAPRLWAHS